MTRSYRARQLFERSRPAYLCTHSHLFHALSHSCEIIVVEARFTMAEKSERASDQEVRETAEMILQARYPIALTGAGMSVESGIPPFRGPGGLWTKYGEPPMNKFQLFMEDPKKAWEERGATRNDELFKPLQVAKPNPGHHALVELEQIGVVKFVITQNVDDLHRQAGQKA